TFDCRKVRAFWSVAVPKALDRPQPPQKFAVGRISKPQWLHRRPKSPGKLRRFITTAAILLHGMSQMLANFIPIVGQPSTQDEQIALARRLILVSGNCRKVCKEKLLGSRLQETLRFRQ